jgi:glycosyltransferase involved in cell wall biosynthesis
MSMTTRSRISVLQAAGAMTCGGTETWLMHVLRHIDRERFQMDFLVDTEQPCHYDDEIRALGGRIVRCLHPTRPLTYAAYLRRAVRTHGPYDVVHSHLHGYNGFVLHLARRFGVPVRIAHSHTGAALQPPGASTRRRAYATLMRRWIDQHATLGLAASGHAAAALFGPRWEDNPRFRIHYCSVDLSPFGVSVDRVALRAALGIPADAFVVGHVGSFTQVKNHAFLVRIGAELAAREPNVRLLLVGDGPLRATIEQQVAAAGLADAVIFTGVRPDVSRLMLGVIDVLLLPSLYEGLPLVGIEAQAAGLPLVASDVVTPELDIVPGLIDRLSLSQSPACWAATVLRARVQGTTIERRAALMQVEQSQFNIVQAVQALEQIYAAA